MRVVLKLIALSSLILQAESQGTTTTTTPLITTTVSTTTTRPSTTTTTVSSSITTTTVSAPTTTTVSSSSTTITVPSSTTSVVSSSSSTTIIPSSTTTTIASSSSSTTTTSPSSTTTVSDKVAAATITTPTSTTTISTTTTVNNDLKATADQLWHVNFYYNWWLGTHAFCADAACVRDIGFGYDTLFGKGLLGKAVSESAIVAVRAACPNGSQNLRNLAFTKSGGHYVANLNGIGLKQGWVSIANGACGAKIPIKSWKSRFTDDMMYNVDLEWNLWYRGMAQNDGNVQFYMWE